MAFFKKAFRKVTTPVRKATRFVDVTSKKSFGGKGRLIAPIARPMVGTMATGLTGGLAAVNPKVRGWAKQGYAAGAAIGGAVMTGGPIAAGQAGAEQMLQAYSPPEEMTPSAGLQQTFDKVEEKEAASSASPGPGLSQSAKEWKIPIIGDVFDWFSSLFGGA